jgi:hypothetical protein
MLRISTGLALAASLAAAGCGEPQAEKEPLVGAPPGAEQGAVGYTEQPGSALSGGPAGQTPEYGEAGGVPDQAQSQPDQYGPATGDGGSPQSGR